MMGGVQQRVSLKVSVKAVCEVVSIYSQLTLNKANSSPPSSVTEHTQLTLLPERLYFFPRKSPTVEWQAFLEYKWT